MKLIVFLNIFISFVLGKEHLDILINEVLKGEKDSALYYLPIVERQYPNNPKMLFLKGLMETDGIEAMQIFVELYRNHPTTIYADDAVMKVAEFYYASGLYIQSAEWLRKMPIYYSRSEHIERAIKLFLNSLIVSGYRDTAIFYSRVFKRQFPSMNVEGKINNLLDQFENSKQLSNNIFQPNSDDKQIVSNPYTALSVKGAELDNNSRKYSLQSGAFSLQKNAESQKVILMSYGYDVRITELYRKTKVLYVVRIGYFNSLKEAEELGLQIKSKYDLVTIVVTNN